MPRRIYNPGTGITQSGTGSPKQLAGPAPVAGAILVDSSGRVIQNKDGSIRTASATCASCCGTGSTGCCSVDPKSSLVGFNGSNQTWNQASGGIFAPTVKSCGSLVGQCVSAWSYSSVGTYNASSQGGTVAQRTTDSISLIDAPANLGMSSPPNCGFVGGTACAIEIQTFSDNETGYTDPGCLPFTNNHGTYSVDVAPLIGAIGYACLPDTNGVITTNAGAVLNLLFHWGADGGTGKFNNFAQDAFSTTTTVPYKGGTTTTTTTLTHSFQITGKKLTYTGQYHSHSQSNYQVAGACGIPAGPISVTTDLFQTISFEFDFQTLKDCTGQIVDQPCGLPSTCTANPYLIRGIPCGSGQGPAPYWFADAITACRVIKVGGYCWQVAPTNPRVPFSQSGLSNLGLVQTDYIDSNSTAPSSCCECNPSCNSAPGPTAAQFPLYNPSLPYSSDSVIQPAAYCCCDPADVYTINQLYSQTLAYGIGRSGTSYYHVGQSTDTASPIGKIVNGATTMGTPVICPTAAQAPNGWTLILDRPTTNNIGGGQVNYGDNCPPGGCLVSMPAGWPGCVFNNLGNLDVADVSWPNISAVLPDKSSINANTGWWVNYYQTYVSCGTLKFSAQLYQTLNGSQTDIVTTQITFLIDIEKTSSGSTVGCSDQTCAGTGGAGSGTGSSPIQPLSPALTSIQSIIFR